MVSSRRSRDQPSSVAGERRGGASDATGSAGEGSAGQARGVANSAGGAGGASSAGARIDAAPVSLTPAVRATRHVVWAVLAAWLVLVVIAVVLIAVL